MAGILGLNEKDALASSDDSPPSRPGEPRLAPFQFRLRTLLAIVAAFGGLFAVMASISAVASVALGWFLLLVGAHVAANCWGERRRGACEHDSVRALSDDLSHDGAPGAATAPHLAMVPRELPFAPRSRLGRSIRLGYGVLAAAGGIAIVSGLGGGYGLASLGFDHFGWPPLAFGVASFAVLGGWLGFLLASFVQVAAIAVWEATRESVREPTGPTV
jgi:hypothetical protein